MNITTKGQVTIPKEIRDRFGLTKGMEVDFVEENGEVKLVKKGSRGPFDKVYGVLKLDEDVDRLIEEMRGR